MRAIAGAVFGLWLALAGAAVSANYKIVDFKSLKGWATDDHAAALSAFLVTCPQMKSGEWPAICAAAKTTRNARQFFEQYFRAARQSGTDNAHFTAYYEPEIEGSLTPTSKYKHAIYKRPPEARGTWLTRRQIEDRGVLKGRGLEIAYVEDPVALLYLHIQGSGRIRLTNGTVLRVGYAGNNGYKFRSVASEMIRRGYLGKHQASQGRISAWVKRNPRDGADVIKTNNRYIFFQVQEQHAASKGPIGAMNRAITAGRSIAVDPKYTPLGSPVWIAKRGAAPMNRLMIAQDTGSAIKGAGRADIYIGSGDNAGETAGRISDAGAMIVLLPRGQASKYASAR